MEIRPFFFRFWRCRFFWRNLQSDEGSYTRIIRFLVHHSKNKSNVGGWFGESPPQKIALKMQVKYDDSLIQ